MSFVQTKMGEFLRWVDSRALFVHEVALSCCSMEFRAAFGPRFDLERFGISLQPEISAADVLILTGPVTDSLAAEIRKLYDEMPGPKYVISVGSCANSGGMFYGSYSVVQGVEKILPVDIFVPGCPPRPEAIIHALTRIQARMRGEASVKA